ncbi:hypothetical protein PENSUB_12540, partial [Penicillium subrubescens]
IAGIVARFPKRLTFDIYPKNSKEANNSTLKQVLLERVVEQSNRECEIGII